MCYRIFIYLSGTCPSIYLRERFKILLVGEKLFDTCEIQLSSRVTLKFKPNKLHKLKVIFYMIF